MDDEARQELVARLVREYAQDAPASRPLSADVLLRDQLGLDSMSLVSLLVRLGDELGVDVGELDLDLGSVKTFADLVRAAGTLGRTPRSI